MLIKLALILSVLLQFGAAILAIGLIRRTQYNISWILISLAFVFMAFRRVYELYEAFFIPTFPHFPLLSSWIAVIISFLIFAGTVFIRKIFDAQKELERLKKQQDARILNAIIKTEENERQRFACNLHDGLGPILSSAKMMLSSISKIGLTSSTKITLYKSEERIDEAIKCIRELSRRMNPHMLESYGLGKALQVLIDNISVPGKATLHFDNNLHVSRLQKDIEIAIYRIISELITNSLKHSGCTEIRISICSDIDEFRLIYTDNGCGFQQNIPQKGMGLFNIESRVKAESGTLKIFSKPGKGFYSDIKIPLK